MATKTASGPLQCSLGVGRIGATIGPTYGAWILTLINNGDLSLHWSFYAFAIPALLTAVLTMPVPRRPWHTTANPTETPVPVAQNHGH
ncbi:hypothetical protein [Streptomyces sp900129855]|uniref:Major facilitator superfamily (MFS) profile domain-containing protein n=1 Tax=Streptomyces sp. 900129855 TaxID=3155129 RepID=A0ABV2ZTY3_9ACTN